MTRAVNWFEILSRIVRDHPKTSAAVAFNLGIIAASATKRAKGAAASITDVSAKVIELVPSLKDIGEYVPLLSASRPRPKPRRRKKRAPARRSRKAAGARS